jgi:hypothetical protein
MYGWWCPKIGDQMPFTLSADGSRTQAADGFFLGAFVVVYVLRRTRFSLLNDESYDFNNAPVRRGIGGRRKQRFSTAVGN